jgi:hypothetical protein
VVVYAKTLGRVVAGLDERAIDTLAGVQVGEAER